MDRVRRYAEQYAKRVRGGRFLAALQLALESGELSKEQVMELASGREKIDEAFRVLREIEFSSQIAGGILERTDVASLLDEPLLPRRHGLDASTMVRTSGEELERRAVTTCRQASGAYMAEIRWIQYGGR